MKRFNWITTTAAAALLACCGMALAQDKGDMKPDAQPGKDAPTAVKPKTGDDAKKADKSAEVKKMQFGDAAPALSIEKWVKGEPITGFEKGRVYIVEFWATWCGPCKVSMPHLSELQKQYKDKGLTIIGVASTGWRDELGKVEDMVKEKGDTMGYTVAWDKDGATNVAYMKASRSRGIPTSFVVDQKGNIAWFGHPMQLDYVIDDVIAGKWDYKAGPAKIEKMSEEADKIREDADADPKGALKSLTAFEDKYPKMAKDMTGTKYMLQLKAEMFADAYKTGGVLVDQAVAKKDAQGLNAIAWGIVDPEGEVKNKKDGLPLAMRAATKAVEITEEKDGAILDTLARCYWLQGNKTKAVELQKKALAVLPKEQEDMKGQLEETLKEYEGGKN